MEGIAAKLMEAYCTLILMKEGTPEEKAVHAWFAEERRKFKIYHPPISFSAFRESRALTSLACSRSGCYTTSVVDGRVVFAVE